MNAILEEQAAKRKAERDVQLEQSKPYVDGRFVPGSFSVGQRDTHHFDISAERRPGYVQWYYEKNPDVLAHPMYDYAQERAFAIRGEPGNIIVRDERWDYKRPYPREPLQFPSVESAMAWIVATLMIK